MKKRTIAFSVLSVSIVAAMLATSCESTSKEVLFPIAGCDSSVTQYTNTIKPILDAQCNSCHSAANATTLGGGTILDNYNDVFNNVDTTTGGNLGSIYQDIITGRMPKSAAKLSDCEAGKIARWIKSGAQNN
jgi:mono/diheme cytochrome c family protein